MTFDEQDGVHGTRAREVVTRAEASSPGPPGVVRDSADPKVSRRQSGQRRAAGIYGTVVVAAVLAAGGASLSTAALAVGVLVTLLVYWAAEQYAELLGEQAEHGHLPTWRRIRSGLSSTWSMVTSAYLPVLALLLARLIHVSPPAAANVALVVALALLILHGVAAGRAAKLHGMQLAVVTAVAAVLGATMILLKDVVLIHLH
jgi:hypothetical protein